MKILYVTDLDGTLLNTKGAISGDSLSVIHSLVEKGMLFTYATARSLTSASVVAKGLSVKLPVITYNGALIMDPETNEIIASEEFQKEETDKVIEILEKYKVSPLVYSYIENREAVSWITGRENYGIQRYLSLRRGDKRLRPLESNVHLYDGTVFYYTCIGEKEQLQPVYDIFSNDKRYTCTLQQELYRPEYWCEIMPKNATKANAVDRLRKLWKLDKVVCFGDAVNDIPMFQISNECYAVANAVNELKQVASGTIGSNDEDGVANWLKENAEISSTIDWK